MSRRTLDRWLDKHGLVTGAELLDVARAFVAVRRQRDMLPGPEGTHAVCGLDGSENLEAFVTRTVRMAYDDLIGASDLALVERFILRLQRRRVQDACEAATPAPPLQRSEKSVSHRFARQEWSAVSPRESSDASLQQRTQRRRDAS